jgi:hypothetical protein
VPEKIAIPVQRSCKFCKSAGRNGIAPDQTGMTANLQTNFAAPAEIWSQPAIFD